MLAWVAPRRKGTDLTKEKEGTSVGSALLVNTKQKDGKIVSPYNLHHLGIEPRTSAWKADILPLN